MTHEKTTQKSARKKTDGDDKKYYKKKLEMRRARGEPYTSTRTYTV